LTQAGDKKAIEAAEFADQVDRERRMTLFRNGLLNRFDAEVLTQEECAKGDAVKREAAEKRAKELREHGARLRAGTI
jgi:hypothetical protein